MSKVIKSVYRMGSLIILVSIIISIYKDSYNIAYSLFFGTASVVVWRVFCELAILFFSINDHLASIKNCNYKQLDAMEEQLL